MLFVHPKMQSKGGTMSSVKRKPKRLTNEQFVTELMTFSNYGALSQLFVIEAIAKWSGKIAQCKPEEIDPTGRAWINAEAWVGVAKEIQQRMKEAGY